MMMPLKGGVHQMLGMRSRTRGKTANGRSKRARTRNGILAPSQMLNACATRSPGLPSFLLALANTASAATTSTISAST